MVRVRLVHHVPIVKNMEIFEGPTRLGWGLWSEFDQNPALSIIHASVQKATCMLSHYPFRFV